MSNIPTHKLSALNGKLIIERAKKPFFTAEYNPQTGSLENAFFLYEVPEEQKEKLFAKALYFMKSFSFFFYDIYIKPSQKE